MGVLNIYLRIVMNRTFVYILVLSLISFPAFSFNARFLENSPEQSFSADDLTMFDAASEKALNNLPDGAKTTWQNPQTGNGGYFQPLSTIKKNGLLCRNLKIMNYNRATSDQYVFMFCKYKSGWK